MKIKSFAAKNATRPLEYFEFERRELTARDVEFEVLYCGVCHSDVHTARNEWKDWSPTSYPCVTGHEIVGKVTRIGKKVTKHKNGDIVGVGCMVNSCRKCKNCKNGLEQYCENGGIFTYNSKDPVDNTITKGGYSQVMVANEDFVLRIPKEMNLAKAAPLLCAGITTYSPLKHWRIKKGMKVGIIGLGGLGHMGLKYAKALGAEVYIITTSPKKAADAKKYGADGVVLMSDKKSVDANKLSFNFLLNTIPVAHSIRPYIDFLASDGTMVIVGAITNLKDGFHGASLIGKRRTIAGSQIGGIKQTQEVLNFSAKHNIYPDIEIIPIEEINRAFDTLVNKGISHRFVIDMKASFKS